MRIALGLSYLGTAYKGWQSQPGGGTVQDHLEQALERFTGTPVRTVCAGRTDAGVHALNQVVHFDTELRREAFSWVRGPNTFLPADIAVEWCREVPDDFHARNGARGRRYAYLVREAPTRPAVEAGRVGWVFRPLDGDAMREAAAHLIGEHDFSAFRSSECQAKSPVKTLREITVRRIGTYWRIDFEASAFLHHMVRNIMGCLVAVGTGLHPPQWLAAVRDSRDRRVAAPTFAAEGLYFLGPRYDERLGLPERTPAFDFLPGASSAASA
ncbi:MAG TPA: tRNA pseudouridine(38-40) synthase TruA [Burkholderiaceae bacterium]|nr:tRNA pseudouridine(38-40) synthase TruA [Burkholderiaceae bacterium]